MSVANVNTNKVPTILPFGDSITAGGGEYSCYREFLVPELKSRGLRFEFIGPSSDDVSAHAGYGGQNTSFLRGLSEELYAEYPADIVLIHSGHNSFAEEKPVPGIVRDTEAIIRTARKINPEVTVVLAQAITSGKLPKYSYIPELNRELTALAGSLTEEGFKIVLVDLADGFEWQTDTVKDMVHPSESGAKKMAAKWFEALFPLLEEYEVNR